MNKRERSLKWDVKKTTKTTGSMFRHKESAGNCEALGCSLQGQYNAERETQGDMLDELSTEFDRQAPASEHLHDDIQELNGKSKESRCEGTKVASKIRQANEFPEPAFYLRLVTKWKQSRAWCCGFELCK